MTPKPEWETYWRLYTFACFALLIFGFGVPETLAYRYGVGAVYSDSIRVWVDHPIAMGVFLSTCTGSVAALSWLMPHIFRRGVA